VPLRRIRRLAESSNRRRLTRYAPGVSSDRGRPSIEDLLVGWETVCDSSGTPTVSGAPTALQGLYFCGMYVSPAGMLREIGIEATRIANHISV